MVVHQLRKILRGVRIVDGAGVVHVDPQQRHGAAVHGPLQAHFAAVVQNLRDQAVGDQDGVALPAFAHGADQGRAGIQDGLDGPGGEQRDIHRGKEDPVAFAQQIPKADPHGVEHLGRFVILVAQEDDAVARQMPLEHGGVVAGDHDDLADPGLGQGRDDPLGHGNGADVQHGLKISHPR